MGTAEARSRRRQQRGPMWNRLPCCSMSPLTPFAGSVHALHPTSTSTATPPEPQAQTQSLTQAQTQPQTPCSSLKLPSSWASNPTQRSSFCWSSTCRQASAAWLSVACQPAWPPPRHRRPAQPLGAPASFGSALPPLLCLPCCAIVPPPTLHTTQTRPRACPCRRYLQRRAAGAVRRHVPPPVSRHRGHRAGLPGAARPPAGPAGCGAGVSGAAAPPGRCRRTLPAAPGRLPGGRAAAKQGSAACRPPAPGGAAGADASRAAAGPALAPWGVSTVSRVPHAQAAVQSGRHPVGCFPPTAPLPSDPFIHDAFHCACLPIFFALKTAPRDSGDRVH